MRIVLSLRATFPLRPDIGVLVKCSHLENRKPSSGIGKGDSELALPRVNEGPLRHDCSLIHEKEVLCGISE